MTTCEISPITITLTREVEDWDLLRPRGDEAFERVLML
jgi:hypothetical protein